MNFVSCRTNQVMSDYMLEKSVLTELLSVFLPQRLHDEFNEKLQESSAIIAGSWSLYLVQTSQERKDFLCASSTPSWIPDDMDIWISSATWPQLENWFLNTAGDKIQPVTFKPLNYGNVLGKHQIYKCESTPIQIIVLHAEDAVQKIQTTVMQHFDLSLVKNFWDGCDLQVFHVKLTKAHQMFLTGVKSHEPRLKKFKNRGFQLIPMPPHDDYSNDITSISIMDIKNKLKSMQAHFELLIPNPNIILINDFIRNYRIQLSERVTTTKSKIHDMQQTLSKLKSITEDSHRSVVDALIEEYNRSCTDQSKENEENLKLCRFLESGIDDKTEKLVDTTCCICVKNPRTMVFQCGHTCCSTCSDKLMCYGNRCFVCREWIVTSHPFYL